MNRQHAHKQTKELGHDGNGQSTFSGSSRDGRIVHHNYLVFDLVKSVIEIKARSVTVKVNEVAGSAGQSVGLGIGWKAVNRYLELVPLLFLNRYHGSE